MSHVAAPTTRIARATELQSSTGRFSPVATSLVAGLESVPDSALSANDKSFAD
jgi:hypothetical protein